MSVFDKNFLHKLKLNTIFIITYCIIFILLYKTFPYTAPFFISGIIAFIINPISQKLEKKLKINKGVSTLILSFLGVTLAVVLIYMFIMSSTKYLVMLLEGVSENSEQINNIVREVTIRANSYIMYIEDAMNINLESVVSENGDNLIDIIKSIIANILGLAGSIPYIFIFIITLFISTYFISKDIDKIEYWFYNIFSDTTRIKVKNVKREIRSSISGYIKSYVIIMGITFLVTFITFKILDRPYATILGVVAATLDFIPFLGIVAIYLPFILYHWIVGNYIVSIFVGIVFLLLSLTRQIIEPKLVSVNIGLNPLTTLAAIFIGVQVKGIIGIIFLLTLVIMHKILRKVDIL